MFKEVCVTTEKDWLDIRSRVVTATEVSIILGLNHYRTVSEMMRDKANPKPFENAYTWVGIALEPIVVMATNKVLGASFKLYEETKDAKSFFVDLDLRLGSTPDAYDDLRLLECKSTKPGNYLRYSGWPPIYYLMQLYTQLLCTNRSEGLLSIMSTNLSQQSAELKLPINIFSINRETKIDEIVISEVERFWKTIDSQKLFRVNRKLSSEVS